MGDLQHFCLRWNNYQSSITSAFENLRDDEDFVDVTLACEGKSLKAHRVVLSACSPYFRELLKSTPCKHPVIVLQDVVYEDLHALVEFIYHGEVNVHQQSLSSFLKTAEVLRVSGLTQQAEASGIGEKWCRDSIPDERGGSPSHFLSRPGRPPLNSHHHRGPPRERPSSAGEASDQQDNSVPMKRAKTSSESVNHMTGGDNQQQSQSLSGGNSGKQESESDQEPPVDFSTNPVPKQPSTKKELSSSGDLPSPLNNLVKSEPIDMALCSINASGENNDDSNDSANDIISESGGGNGNGNLQQSQEHDDNMQSGGGNHHGYLDSKLFAAGASFNFSMAAALAADSLAGLNNQSHVSGVDGLAGTSQEHEGRGWDETTGIIEGEEIDEGGWDQMMIPTSSSVMSPLSSSSSSPSVSMPSASTTSFSSSTNCRTTCPVCGKRFSRSWSLQRHMADMHYPSERRHNCVDCGRSYRSRNSLTSHRCQYHGKPKSIF